MTSKLIVLRLGLLLIAGFALSSCFDSRTAYPPYGYAPYGYAPPAYYYPNDNPTYVYDEPVYSRTYVYQPPPRYSANEAREEQEEHERHEERQRPQPALRRWH